MEILVYINRKLHGVRVTLSTDFCVIQAGWYVLLILYENEREFLSKIYGGAMPELPVN